MTGPLGPQFRPGVAGGRHLLATHAVQAICARALCTPHLGLFVLDVNAEPSAPLWAPSAQRRAHQGEQRRARRHLSITSSAMASSVGGTSMPSALVFAAVSSLASGNVSRCRSHPIGIAGGPTNVRHVAAFGPTQLRKPLGEPGQVGLSRRIVFVERHQHADPPQPFGLLRPCRERPHR